MAARDISTVDGEAAYFNYSATLRIFGDIEDLDAISRSLNLKPTYCHRRGEKRKANSPEFKGDLWSYSLPVPEERPLDEHVQALWKILKPHRDYILNLKSTLNVDVFCGYRTNHWGAGFEVQPKSLEMFVVLDIPFGVSVIIA